MGRSTILKYDASWSGNVSRRQTAIALGFSALFVLFGLALFLGSPGSLSSWPGLGVYFAIAAVVVVVVGPVAGVLAGTKRSGY
jgi:hypothetical protein